MSEEPLSDLTTTPEWWDTYQGVDPEQAKRDITGQILDAITNHPRSLQKRIGPSEIGTPCTHCLAARLAGWEKKNWGSRGQPLKGQRSIFGSSTFSWTRILAAQTTWLGDTRNGGCARRPCGSATSATPRSQAAPTSSTSTPDKPSTGNSSAKTASKNTGPKALPIPTGSKPTYTAGAGNAEAAKSTQCRSYSCPHSQPRGDHFWWSEPYDEQIALAALERANHLDKQIRTLRAFAGEEAVTQWISGLDRADGCFDCRKYPDYTPPPQVEGG